MKRPNGNGRASKFAILTIAAATLSACGGGGGSTPPPPPTYSVTGTVTGLNGTVVLQFNGGADIAVSTNGPATFATSLQNGTNFAVTIKTQPSSPAQVCTVTSGQSAIVGANVTNVAIDCILAPLALVTGTPANGAPSVNRYDNFVLDFSAPLVNNGVSTASASLSSNGRSLAFNARTISGSRFTLTPPLLLPAAPHTLTIGSGLRGTGGEQLTAPITINFTTVDGTWGTSSPVESNTTGDATNVNLAVNLRGEAFAVWEQNDGARTNIWASRTGLSQTWQTPTLVESNNVGSARRPKVAVDEHGSAIAVWEHFDGTRYNVWANRYNAGGSWETPVLIETQDLGDVQLPEIAVDPNGNAIAVWSQWDGTRFNAWANRYSSGGGWGTATAIEIRSSGVGLVRVAVDSSGNGLAVWSQSDGTQTSIYSNRYLAGGGWNTATLIESDSAGAASEPHIAADSAGNALAVWYQSDGTRDNIWANRFTSSGGWGTAALIETDNTGGAVTPRVRFDPGGNAIAVWLQHDGTRMNIAANRFVPDTGWSTATLIESNDFAFASRARIALDLNGNAVAVWEHSDGVRTSVWSNRYVVGRGWGTSTALDVSTTTNAFSPQIEINAFGNGLAAWVRNTGALANIRGNVFSNEN